MKIQPPKLDRFLGTNNALNPSSAMFREGMATYSYQARLDHSGMWSAQPTTTERTATPGTSGLSGTGHVKALAIGGAMKLFTLGADESIVTGTNGGDYVYGCNSAGTIYRSDGTTAAAVSALTPPTWAATPLTENAAGSSSRAENGTYYYMCTLYNTLRKVESLPSVVHSAEIDHDNSKISITATLASAVAEDHEVRVYRSLRTNETEAVFNPIHTFYYVGKIDAAGTTFVDYEHDSDIQDSVYEGRGSAPPSGVDYIGVLNDRVLYFKKGTVYWSSSGRPEEVAQDYTITVGSETIDKKPLLSLGIEGEAKKTIDGLAGKTVVAGTNFGTKYLVFTAASVGYLEESGRGEGYRFNTIADDVGAVSDKVLAKTPFGLFGADSTGIWLMDKNYNFVRLDKGQIDLFNSTDQTGEDNYFKSAFDGISGAWGVWIPKLNEYWLGANDKVIPFQADRGVFVGPYAYTTSNGACALSDANGNDPYVGGVTPTTAINTTTSYKVILWFGQASSATVKENIEFEILTIGASDSIVVGLTTNNIPHKTTDAPAGGENAVTQTLTSDYSIIKLPTHHSGRFMGLSIEGKFRLASIAYQANVVSWNERHDR